LPWQQGVDFFDGMTFYDFGDNISEIGFRKPISIALESAASRPSQTSFSLPERIANRTWVGAGPRRRFKAARQGRHKDARAGCGFLKIGAERKCQASYSQLGPTEWLARQCEPNGGLARCSPPCFTVMIAKLVRMSFRTSKHACYVAPDALFRIASGESPAERVS